MNWYDKAPLSLRKRAGDVVEFPGQKWIGKDPQRGSDLNLVADRGVDRLKALMHYMEDTLEPGELHKYHEAIENALVEFLGSVYRIEESLQKKEEEGFFAPDVSGEVLNLSKDD